MFRKIFIIIFLTLSAACSTTGENTSGENSGERSGGGNPNFLAQSDIAGTWNFVANAGDASYGEVAVASTDGAVTTNAQTVASGSMISRLPVANNTVIAAARGFIVGVAKNATIANNVFDYYTRTESGQVILAY